MGTIHVGEQNSAAIELYYEDQGDGRPVVLLHGWPFDLRSWEAQLHPLLDAGFRVVAYDRRGFGRSSVPTVGYDFDTLSADLDVVIRTLDLQDATIISFSLGTGELARYVGKYGTERLRSMVFIESLIPTFRKGPDNPNGIDAAGVAGIQAAILADRFAWLQGMMGTFLNLDDYLGKLVSQETVTSLQTTSSQNASPWATWKCPETWLEDFTDDIRRIDKPTMIIHGSADRILSIDGQGTRAHEALPQAEYVTIDGGPHINPVTHRDQVNGHLLSFLAGS